MGQPKSRGANLTPPPPSITKQRPVLDAISPMATVAAVAAGFPDTGLPHVPTQSNNSDTE